MRFFIWEFYEPRNQDLYYLPLRHIFGRIARLRALIVDQSQFAALFTWGDPIQANVEFGTVRRISIFGMWVRQAEAVPFRQSSFRAFEAVLWNLVFCSKREKKNQLSGHACNCCTCKVYKFAIITGWTTRSLCLSRPVADTTEFVEPKSGWASVFLSGTLHTSVENVAYIGVRVSIETVQPRAQIIGTSGCFCRVNKEIFNSVIFHSCGVQLTLSLRKKFIALISMIVAWVPRHRQETGGGGGDGTTARRRLAETTTPPP